MLSRRWRLRKRALTFASATRESQMTRRKQQQREYRKISSRKERIEKLIARGWMKSAAEIPADGFPVDPDLLNLGGSYERPICYRPLDFHCVDCRKPQRWEVQDQRWYYEEVGAFFFSTAIRCRPCRKLVEQQKEAARQRSRPATPEGKTPH
jgi:hypothetical protein